MPHLYACNAYCFIARTSRIQITPGMCSFFKLGGGRAWSTASMASIEDANDAWGNWKTTSAASSTTPPTNDSAGNQSSTLQEKQQQYDIERLAREAVMDILHGVAKRRTGGCCVPVDWRKKCFPTLGPYKHFVKSQAKSLVFAKQPNGSFTITKANGVSSAASSEVLGKVQVTQEYHDGVICRNYLKYTCRKSYNCKYLTYGTRRPRYRKNQLD